MRISQLLVISTVAATLSVASLVGCSQNKTMSRPDNRSAEHHADELDGIVDSLNRASTPAEEADALRKLHKYETDHGLTYTVKAIRMSDGKVIPAASVSTDPLTVNVTILRQQEVIRRFSFQPRDNANLALLGT